MKFNSKRFFLESTAHRDSRKKEEAENETFLHIKARIMSLWTS